MKTKSLFKADMKGGECYHVYNQTNNKEPLFITYGNRNRFINKMNDYMRPFSYIFAFNLMSNHFHSILEIKKKEEVLRNLSKKEIAKFPSHCRSLLLEDEDNMPAIMENRWQAFCNGYVKYFNAYHGRNGNLFHKSLCRKEITSLDYLKRATYYVHANSIRHGVTKSITDYDWTSYNLVEANDDEVIRIEKLFEYFGGEKSFYDYHKKGIVMVDEDKKFIIEEEDLFLEKPALQKDDKRDLLKTTLRKAS